jgi:hypothetical protein
MAFRGNYIPPGFMAIKHTEFMRLTQGNKSLTDYLQAFNNLARYATKFVDTDAKNIASFKRGLGPKLMKTMGTSKCTTFNDFISDALTQENNNSIYAASKSRKRALEAVLHNPELQLHQGLLLTLLPQVLSSVPRKRRRQLRLGFTKHISWLCLRVVLVKATQMSLQATCLAGTTTNQVIGLGIVHILRRMQIKVAVRGMFIIIVLKKFHLVK